MMPRSIKFHPISRYLFANCVILAWYFLVCVCFTKIRNFFLFFRYNLIFKHFTELRKLLILECDPYTKTKNYPFNLKNKKPWTFFLWKCKLLSEHEIWECWVEIKVSIITCLQCFMQPNTAMIDTVLILHWLNF